MRKVFDTHVQLGLWGEQEVSGEFIKPLFGRELRNYGDAKLFMQSNNIEKAIFTPHSKPNQAESYSDNHLIIECLNKIDGFYGSLYFNPSHKFSELVNENLKLIQDKIVAVKLNSNAWGEGVNINPETWTEGFKKNIELIMDEVRYRKLILQLQIGVGSDSIKNLIPFINEYGSELKIQFMHMGGDESSSLSFIPQFIKWLKEGNNFYCDTSYCKGFAPAWLINTLNRDYREGLNNILFASNEPWGVYKSEYWRLAGVNSINEVKDLIFYKNAIKAFLS